MKRDGRTLDHATLEEFRLLALRRVREGEKPSEVVKSLGMNRTSIYRWLKAASGRGKGERALVSRPATGRPSRLSAAQQAQVFRWINGKDPRQYGLDFGLWTRQIAAALIEQKFGVSLGVTAVGRVLARLGLTPQKPLQRAYQRDPQAIERWQSETYPGIAAAAKQSGADIYFWDESGFRADTVHGKTWAPKGKTPVVERPGQRQSISAASAVNAKGGFWFATYQGALNAELFIELPGHRQSLQVRHTESLPQGLPAFSRLPRDVELPRYSCSGAFPPQARLLAAQEVTANPSLEPTRSGKSPWPPSAEYHVAPVGQGALPPRSAQLKR